ncbi:MAG: flavodoxin family protein [Dehalococcoidia bacterium]|tara:strand:- start:204 stop:791 length:588 start_codon:yes stop_codon:yes gene_type:complete
MTISVLGIAGGTRTNGNSEILLDNALLGASEAGADTTKVSLLDRSISSCICPQSEDCLLTGICTVQDDMQAIYSAIRSSDLIFIAFPIAFRSVPAQTKQLFDRTQAIWVSKYLLKERIRNKNTGKGFIISTADTDSSNEFDGAIQSTRSWLATIDFKEEHRLLVSNVTQINDIYSNTEALETAYKTGFSLVETST